ncbi:hypothetical protein TNCV_3403021 [Trichonephila clavipes]|nr:hypothetical protein TNCV_3403021 [Trichonephila clavipes]
MADAAGIPKSVEVLDGEKSAASVISKDRSTKRKKAYSAPLPAVLSWAYWNGLHAKGGPTRRKNYDALRPFRKGAPRATLRQIAGLEGGGSSFSSLDTGYVSKRKLGQGHPRSTKTREDQHLYIVARRNKGTTAFHISNEVQVAKVPWLACQEFEPSATEDPPCRGAMHVESVEISNFLPLVW